MDTITTTTNESPLEDEFRQEVKDARLLLDFVIAQRPALDDPQASLPVDDKIITAIKTIETQLLEPGLPPQDARIAFEAAYRDLAIIAKPVTARSLRDTSDQFGWASLLTGRYKRSQAIVWSRYLWLITLFFLGAIFFDQLLVRILDTHYPLDEESDEGMVHFLSLCHTVLATLSRYSYGGLGACAYLLRSCHVFIYRREFNSDRIPEYLNRILLGVVSGGAILLFVDQISGDGGSVTISEATLAFLAGYSSDFLFKAIERVSDAILPKIGLESLPKARPEIRLQVSMTELLDRLEKATTPEDKKAIRDLITQLQKRI